MRKTPPIQRVPHPDRISSYFKLEIRTLAAVTVTGIVYNAGMAAGPYFEGQLVQCLLDIMNGRTTLADMTALALTYLAVILLVQLLRCVKRFCVRRFANNTSRNMRHMLYNNLIHRSRVELEEEGMGAVMTRAVADVDACAEGMRKFTTEVFDTGVALLAYLTLLFLYDWRLALLSCAFTPAAYLLAGRMKTVVTRYHAAYKKSAERLSDATLDRVSNAVTYRVYGRERDRDGAYERQLTEYETRAVAANIWESTLQPLYQVISMCGVVPILWFGARNVLGTGWAVWDIAAFTTFLACFAKLAVKSSKAAKLFNSVQKARVSWQRIQPLMKDYVEPDTATELDFSVPRTLNVSHLSVSYPGGGPVLRDVSFTAAPGQIIGVTGPVASGKSTLGKVFLSEFPYGGSVRLGERELSSLSEYERTRLVAYMGHRPELMSDTLRENIRLGEERDETPYLCAVRLDREVAEMPDGADTFVGSGGVRLSGGQQARVALARTLYHGGALLILDDPFSAVDQATEREIMGRLRVLAKDCVVLLLSHRLSLFSQLDGVLWLDGGVGDVQTHGNLLRTNALYAGLYRAQTEGEDLDEGN